MIRRFLILMVFWNVGYLAAQDPNWQERMEQFSQFAQEEKSEDYRLGPGDLIEIDVFGVDDFDRDYRVSSSGNITVPFLGRIAAEGKTGAELEEEVTRLIIDRDLIRDPQVSVFIKQYRSQPVYVLGAVNQPGQYMITQSFTLLDLITMAGGLKIPTAEDYALVHRWRVPVTDESEKPPPADVAPPQSEVFRVDLKGLLEDGKLVMNIPVKGGDVIQVPERKVEIFYVVGEVVKPGAYEFPKDEGKLMSTHAIAWAGGTGKTANPSKGTLIRYDSNEQPQILAVNFKNIMKGKEPDFAIQPRDVLFIPGSQIKTIGYGLLNIIPSTVQWAIIWNGLRRD